MTEPTKDPGEADPADVAEQEREVPDGDDERADPDAADPTYPA